MAEYQTNNTYTSQFVRWGGGVVKNDFVEITIDWDDNTQNFTNNQNLTSKVCVQY